MADPFEVRMRFTNLLTHLSASATASIKAAQYALKHRDMDEDLHSCIIENLERGNNMNNRANIMYFLEHHADLNIKDGGHEAYMDMVRRDMERIVDAVAQSGANVKVVRRVVGGLGDRGVLPNEMVGTIENKLKDKEESITRLLGDEDTMTTAERGNTEAENDTVAVGQPAVAGSNGGGAAGGGEERRPADHSTRVTPRTGGGQGSVKSNGVTKMDKRAIEQRIEEDRERNKRLRESVWAVSGDDEQELDRLWDETSELGEDDYIIANEEAEERRQFAEYHRSLTEP